MDCQTSTQIWGYDDLLEFQATQQDLSTQIGRTPALSFCPTCGIFLMDTGSTEAERDAHIQSCRDKEDPEGLDIVSEGEDSDDASEESATVHRRVQANKKHKLAACTDPQKASTQENSLAPASVHAKQALQSQDTSQILQSSHRPAAGVLTKASASVAVPYAEQKQGQQVSDPTHLHRQISPHGHCAMLLSNLTLVSKAVLYTLMAASRAPSIFWPNPFVQTTPIFRK